MTNALERVLGDSSMTKIWGPQTPECDAVHASKYRQQGESFRAAMSRIASPLCDSDSHFAAFREILLEMRFMPAGRIQASIGATRVTTPYNCFVSGTIEDSFTKGHGSIMGRAEEAATTMRLGGGIGFDFSTLRPRGELIKTLDSQATGPVSFMPIYDAVGAATSSSGHRRGAEMGVLRVDHPDIEIFIHSKQNSTALTCFNISVAVTDEFMRAVEFDDNFTLQWNGKRYREIRARDLWDSIMRSNYDWSEPGVLFIDTINRMNNLYYCEEIAATNPCGEQPLPPYGACLLGSINLPKYLFRSVLSSRWSFDFKQLHMDIPHIVRAMDNVIDYARYPLHEQEQEAKRKRRMGLGVTGAANAIEAMGYPYGSDGFIHMLKSLLSSITNACYRASALLAREKSPFPLYRKDAYCDSQFILSLDSSTQELIADHGIRNSHLTSIAPTGTISFAADNISSGIEPVFSYNQIRSINGASGPYMVEIVDYGVKFLGIKGKTAAECSAEEHLKVIMACAPHIDSAVSKTLNVPKDTSWDEFKSIYFKAWKAQCKGCTTHRTGNFRGAVIVSADSQAEAETVETPTPEPFSSDSSCLIDPNTGKRDCS